METISASLLARLEGRCEVTGRADTLEGDKRQEQAPPLLPLDLGGKSADGGPPRPSIIQSTIHG